jgi:hypothetical protein
MKTPWLAGGVVLLLLTGCGNNSNTSKAAATNNAASDNSNPLNAPANYLGALANGQQRAIKTTDTTSLDKAIQLFNVDKGRNPKDLNELVQDKYIPRLPEAPYGMKLVYHADTGTVTVEKQ